MNRLCLLSGACFFLLKVSPKILNSDLISLVLKLYTLIIPYPATFFFVLKMLSTFTSAASIFKCTSD